MLLEYHIYVYIFNYDTMICATRIRFAHIFVVLYNVTSVTYTVLQWCACFKCKYTTLDDKAHIHFHCVYHCNTVQCKLLYTLQHYNDVRVFKINHSSKSRHLHNTSFPISCKVVQLQPRTKFESAFYQGCNVRRRRPHRVTHAVHIQTQSI